MTIGGWDGFIERQKELLFGKRSKNFFQLTRALRQRVSQYAKVFWFFFAIKNCFLFYWPQARAPPWPAALRDPYGSRTFRSARVLIQKFEGEFLGH
jgi:hypothetical protein